jgi:hypothetical protein
MNRPFYAVLILSSALPLANALAHDSEPAKLSDKVAVMLAGNGRASGPPIKVQIRDHKVVGIQTLKVTQGDEVHIQWLTEEKVELHLHGYNIELTVDSGSPESMVFTAKATGRFPVTSHSFGDKHGHAKQARDHSALLYIEVHPR